MNEGPDAIMESQKLAFAKVYDKMLSLGADMSSQNSQGQSICDLARKCLLKAAGRLAASEAPAITLDNIITEAGLPPALVSTFGKTLWVGWRQAVTAEWNL